MKVIATAIAPLLLLLCLTMNADSAPDKVVVDFQSPTHATWQIVNDDVMGGVSTSSFCITNGVAVFRGEVSLQNNGPAVPAKPPGRWVTVRGSAVEPVGRQPA